MIVALAVVGILCTGYVLLILWAVFWRGPFQVVYNSLIAPLIRSQGMQATTIGARCYLASPTNPLSASGLIHETFHYEQQWRKYPFTFLPRYFSELLRYGYQNAPMEVAARAAAGEPQ